MKKVAYNPVQGHPILRGEFPLRSARNYEVDRVSRETAMFDDQEKWPDRAIQSEKDNADINVIVRRFGVGAQMQTPAKLPSYGDYNGVSDFQTAMNIVREAREKFMELPASIRKRFGNDPQAYLEYVSNKDNIDEMVKMGLAVKKPVKEEVKNEPGSTPSGKTKVGKPPKNPEGNSGSEPSGSE